MHMVAIAGCFERPAIFLVKLANFNLLAKSVKFALFCEINHNDYLTVCIFPLNSIF